MLNYFVWDFEGGIDLELINLRFYSLMFMLSFVFSFYIMKNIFVKENVDLKILDKLFFWSFFATIFGARIGHVLFYDIHLFKEDFLSVFLPIRTKPTFQFTGFSGLASHGATIAFLFMIYFFSSKILKRNFFWLADRIVIPISLSAFFIRLGNFFNSEIIGKPTDSAFAVLFKNQSSDYGKIVPRHPSQLYEGVLYLILFFVLLYIYYRTELRNKVGFIFGLFLSSLWLIRFLVEFTKEGQTNEYINIFSLNTGQILSIPFFIIGLITLFYSIDNKV